MRRRAVAWLVVLLVLLVPSPAHAHGKLKSSTPRAGAHLGMAPRELRLDFNETAALAFSHLRLVAPGGGDVALGTLAHAADSPRAIVAPIAGRLAAGTYTVYWQFAGDDGHPVRGTFGFTVAPGAMPPVAAVPVQPPTAAADTAAHVMHHDPASMPGEPGFGVESPAYVALRWAQFVALLLAIGAVSFTQLVLRALRRDWAYASSFTAAAASRAARIGLVAIALLAVTLVLRLVAQSAAMHEGADAWNAAHISDMISTTAWGQGWLVQLAGTVVAAIGLGIAARRPAGGWAIATAGVLLLAVSASLGGHAAARPHDRAFAIASDASHVLAAGSWLGTLALVLLAAIPAARTLDDAACHDAIARVVRAFSPVALASAGVVTLTGVVAAWLHLGRVPALWGTRYGVTLLAKLAILAIVALTGFYNWRVLQPRLGHDDATVRLRRSATIEVGIAVLVLLVTAVLVATPTAFDA